MTSFANQNSDLLSQPSWQGFYPRFLLALHIQLGVPCKPACVLCSPPRPCTAVPHKMPRGIVPTLTTLWPVSSDECPCQGLSILTLSQLLTFELPLQYGVYAKALRRVSFPTSGCFWAQSIQSYMTIAPSAFIPSPPQVPKSVNA